MEAPRTWPSTLKPLLAETILCAFVLKQFGAMRINQWPTNFPWVPPTGDHGVEICPQGDYCRLEESGGGMNWEIGIDMYTLMCIKLMTNKNLLYKKKKRKNLFIRFIDMCAI